ncbi:MAG: hypothetical protein P4L50_14595, partial [Anaerolineaceae bacterium]|nr:hypothetical protein [Anaerolineaceae bacterium]
ECHIFGLTSAFSPNQKCAAYSETVCGMLRLSVRLTPFYCAACSVFCISLFFIASGRIISRQNTHFQVIFGGA